MNLMICAALFVAYVVIDALYAVYTIATTKMQPVKAATTGAIIHALVAYGVIEYTKDWRYIAPIIAGSWIGTYLAVFRAKLSGTLPV